MNETNYAKIREWFLAKELRLKVFMFLNGFLPFIVFLSYAVLILWLLVSKDIRIYKVILIPFIIFVSVSIIRKIIDSPRPYVVLNIEPLVKREKNGESFPSRHVLSVSIIAVAFFFINPWIGAFMSVLTVLIAALRVLSGVHFIKDVLCGALISYILGSIAFLLF